MNFETDKIGVAPERLLRSGASDLAVRAFIALTIVGDGERTPSRISGLLGPTASLQRARRALKQLEELGFLVKGPDYSWLAFQPTMSLPAPKAQPAAKEAKQEKAEALEAFSLFWAGYPRKVGKEQAKHEWLKLNPSADLVERILKAVGAWARSEQWLKDEGQFIPHPRTFLHNRRWEDELPASAPQSRQKGLSL